MFPFNTSLEAEIPAGPYRIEREPNRIPSRLDYQRRLLEYKKMQSTDLTMFYLKDPKLNARLERKRQFIESFDDQPSLLDRIRTRFGRTLIAVGERIRPEDVVTERTANA